MNVQEVAFVSEEKRLSGTLVLPDMPVAGSGPDVGPPGAGGRPPCVLLLPGSGQVDRDENHKRLRLNVLRELALFLAGQGIGSLRYDKRGVGASEGDYWSTGFYDHVTDAGAALAFLKERSGVDARRLFVLGHSEGAYLAVRLAAERPDAVAGSVLLAGGARPGEEELLWQGRRVTETLTGFSAFLVRLLRIDPVKQQKKYLEKLKRSTEDSHRVQLRKVNAKWMREFLAYDPSVDLPKVRVPVLAITGAKDIQVDPGNLERMGQLVTAPFESHVVPDVTHLLRSESGPGGLGTYKKPLQRPTDPRVLSLVGDWLMRQAAGR